MLLAITFCCPPGAMALGTTDVIAPGAWQASATVEVYIPQSADPIVYSLDMAEAPAPADTLLPCAYVMRWRLPRPSDTTSGWTAYHGGNLYQCRGNRLKEYHMEADPVPFTPRSVGITRGQGVHRSVQFIGLLPTLLRERLDEVASDTAQWQMQQPRDGTLRLWRRNDGLVIEESELRTDPQGRPLYYEVITSPGSISEQTMVVRYCYDRPWIDEVPTSEDAVIEMFPDDFAQWRQSNFSIDRMPGQPLPQFTSPTPTGERYTYHRGDALRAPTMIALLDPSIGSTPQVIAALRQAQEALPRDTDLILAFTSNNIDEIDALAGACRQQERILLGARALVRDLGAASLPVVVLASSDGRVADVITAYNNDLSDIVMQKMALVR